MKVKRLKNLYVIKLLRIDKMWNVGNPEVNKSENHFRQTLIYFIKNKMTFDAKKLICFDKLCEGPAQSL